MSDDDQEQYQSMVNPLPAVVVVMVLAILAVEIVFGAASRGLLGGADGIGWRVEAVNEFGFFPELVRTGLESGQLLAAEPHRFLTYTFIHISFTHTVFVIVFLLALGKLIGEVLGPVAVAATFALAAIFGAIIYGGLSQSGGPLIGGFPAVYGLIGSYTFLLWVGYGATGENQWRAFMLIGVLLGIQLFFGILFGSNSDWIAELAGFLIGFAIAPLVSRGGFRRLLGRLRQR